MASDFGICLVRISPALWCVLYKTVRVMYSEYYTPPQYVVDGSHSSFFFFLAHTPQMSSSTIRRKHRERLIFTFIAARSLLTLPPGVVEGFVENRVALGSSNATAYRGGGVIFSDLLTRGAENISHIKNDCK